MILLYGLDMWVLLATIDRKVEGIHTGFLCQITGESSEAAKIRDIGDAWGGRRTGGRGKEVCGDLHR